MKALAAFVVALTVMPAIAEARMHHPYRGHRIVQAGQAPLDGMTNPSGAYGFRKLLSAYAGPAVRIRRASDNAEVDINFLGFTGFTGAPWDEVAATSHCAATSCFVHTLYDQSGNARNLTQTTAANQPPLVFGCVNGVACLQTAAVTNNLNGPSFTPATGAWSVSVVGNRTVGTGNCLFFRENASVNRLQAQTAANTWGLLPAPALAGAAADNQWHAAAALTSLTPGASVLNIDGVETTGTPVPTTAAGVIGVIGAAATTCRQTEAIFWDNYALTPAERTVLVNNQRSFWGF